MSDVLMDLQTHYKAVRARLNAGPPPKPIQIDEPAPEPVKTDPEPVLEGPLTVWARSQTEHELLRGLRCASEAKEQILCVLKKHRMSWKEVVARDQRWKYSECRFEIYANLNARGWSLPQIGRLCGGRDHTTVLSGIRRFIKKNMTPMKLQVCEDVGMRPVVYCVRMLELREMKDDA